eukprot:88882-Rhodomonas_salina.1
MRAQVSSGRIVQQPDKPKTKDADVPAAVPPGEQAGKNHADPDRGSEALDLVAARPPNVSTARQNTLRNHRKTSALLGRVGSKTWWVVLDAMASGRKVPY